MANEFNIQIKGLDELIRDANAVGGKFPQMMTDAMVASTTGVQNDAKRVRSGSFKNQTGDLRRSITRRVEGPQKGIIFTDVKYAPYVEFGTKPHVITPKNKKMLAFKSGGRLIFAKKVNHPGTKAYNYMRDAFEENKPKIIKIYDQMALKIVRELGK